MLLTRNNRGADTASQLIHLCPCSLTDSDGGIPNKKNNSAEWRREIRGLSTTHWEEVASTRPFSVTSHGCSTQTEVVMVMFVESGRFVFVYILTSRESEHVRVTFFWQRWCEMGVGWQGFSLEAFRSLYTSFWGLFMFLWKISLWNPCAAHFNLICGGEWCWDRPGESANVSLPFSSSRSPSFFLA